METTNTQNFSPKTAGDIAAFLNANKGKKITINGYTNSKGEVTPSMTVLLKATSCYRDLMLQSCSDVEALKGISPMHAKVAGQLLEKWRNTLSKPTEQKQGSKLTQIGVCWASSEDPETVALVSVEMDNSNNNDYVDRAVKVAGSDEVNVLKEIMSRVALSRYMPRLNLKVGKFTSLCAA